MSIPSPIGPGSRRIRARSHDGSAHRAIHETHKPTLERQRSVLEALAARPGLSVTGG